MNDPSLIDVLLANDATLGSYWDRVRARRAVRKQRRRVKRTARRQKVAVRRARRRGVNLATPAPAPSVDYSGMTITQLNQAIKDLPAEEKREARTQWRAARRAHGAQLRAEGRTPHMLHRPRGRLAQRMQTKVDKVRKIRLVAQHAQTALSSGSSAEEVRAQVRSELGAGGHEPSDAAVNLVVSRAQEKLNEGQPTPASDAPIETPPGMAPDSDLALETATETTPGPLVGLSTLRGRFEALSTGKKAAIVGGAAVGVTGLTVLVVVLASPKKPKIPKRK